MFVYTILRSRIFPKSIQGVSVKRGGQTDTWFNQTGTNSGEGDECFHDTVHIPITQTNYCRVFCVDLCQVSKVTWKHDMSTDTTYLTSTVLTRTASNRTCTLVKNVDTWSPDLHLWPGCTKKSQKNTKTHECVIVGMCHWCQWTRHDVFDQSVFKQRMNHHQECPEMVIGM